VVVRSKHGPILKQLRPLLLLRLLLLVVGLACLTLALLLLL
jgi:hypothetical protein